MSRPTFFFTYHPGDLIRARILKGANIMVVAAAHWDNDRKRFKIKRPPREMISGLAIDSGGFTAAARWGEYPWSVQQYVDFILEMSESAKLIFCAIMDYACERGVDRSVHKTNINRINTTIENSIACHQAAPTLPWLDVYQGNTLKERAYDLRRRAKIGWHLKYKYVGLGSVCRRNPIEGREIINFYASQEMGVRYHVFGAHIQIFDDPVAFAPVKSWDSYSWNWGRGTDLKPQSSIKKGETYSNVTYRMAQTYWTQAVCPRLIKHQPTLL